MNDCFLCTAPAPSDKEDADAAYLCGFADGVLAVKCRKQKYLCTRHTDLLVELLKKNGAAASYVPPAGIRR